MAVNVGVQYLFKSLLSDISPEVECLYHIIILCFISEEPPCCFLKQEYYFAFPPAMQKGSSITNSCYFLGFCLFVFFLFFTFFSNSCPIECEVFHCGFNLHFPNDWWCWALFSVLMGHLYVFFGGTKRNLNLLPIL